MHIALELDDDPFVETTEAHNEAVQNVLSAELQPENPSDVTTTASRSKQNLALCYGNMRNETGHSFPLSRRERGTGGRTKGAAGQGVRTKGAQGDFLLAAVGTGMGGLGLFAVATFVLTFFGSPLFTLTNDVIIGSAPPERAGAASGISEMRRAGWCAGHRVLRQHRRRDLSGRARRHVARGTANKRHAGRDRDARRRSRRRSAAPRRRGRGTARHCPRRIRARPRALSGHQRNRNARARRLRLGDVSPEARRTGVVSSHQTTTCGGLATLDGERCRRYADLTRRSPR